MLSLLLATASEAHFYPNASSRVNDPKHIAMLNSQPNTTWTAGYNARFEGLNYEEARLLLGTSLSHIADHMDQVLPEAAYAGITDADVPSSFDATTHWSGLVHPIRDQQRCGSCWAFSATEVLGDRVAIARGRASPVLSPEDLVSCDKSDMGCHGGQLSTAWSYLKNTGAVTDTCFPYAAGSGTAPACANKCSDHESWSSSKQKAASAYAIHGVANMQKEIMTNGPVQVAFNVYKSFMSYKSGVYKKHFYELIPEGGHAVKLVGWGTEGGKDYWLVANSWNTNWGLSGYFKIARGSNECGIEKRGPPYAGMPAV